MIVRLGHYYFDSKPLIGTIADFNIWDNMLRHKFHDYNDDFNIMYTSGFATTHTHVVVSVRHPITY